MSINYFDWMVAHTRQAAEQSRRWCVGCYEERAQAGDSLCATCRKAETERFERSLDDPYHYTRTECAGCRVGQASPEEPYCVSCRFKHEQFNKAVTKTAKAELPLPKKESA